jgi:hypothetical protein
VPAADEEDNSDWQNMEIKRLQR